MSPEASHGTNFRPLHAAASSDSVRVGQLLIDRGAQIDPRESRFDGVPLGWALYGKRPRMTALLGGLSRWPWALAWMGNVARLRELFAENPELAKVAREDGSLFVNLPEDETLAMEIAELLLAYGADPLVKNKEGLTAVQYLERRGLGAVADMIETHARAGGA
jgi:hypothetical protein